MKKIFALALVTALLALSSLPAAASRVYVIEVNGIIDPAVLNYIQTTLALAEQDGSEAVIVLLDTPGGMLDSTKKIVQEFLDSDVPVVVYVHPPGASATSAGMMITVAGHVAVMAPGTNIGAAHPVIMPFGVKYEPVAEDDVMMEKATNDTVGWIRSVSEVRKRNLEWVEKAVTESESITASEAVEKNVVDGVVPDLDTLLNGFLPGRVVEVKNGDTVSLDTGGAEIVRHPMSLRQQLQHVINNPNVILVLLLLGGLGVALEMKAPGMIFPALIGVGLILLALLAPSLPINYIGLLLIALAFVFLVAEVFVTSYGLLTLAGVASLIVGALMLFNTEEAANVTPSWTVILSIAGFVVAVVLIFGGAILAAHRSRVTTGAEGLVGEITRAETPIDQDGGKVMVWGELWNAFSPKPIAKGEKVVIKSVNNLSLTVEKIESGTPGPKPPGKKVEPDTEA